jgi:hypothetical protein
LLKPTASRKSLNAHRPLLDALGGVVGVVIVRLKGCLRWVYWRLREQKLPNNSCQAFSMLSDTTEGPSSISIR